MYVCISKIVYMKLQNKHFFKRKKINNKYSIFTEID